MKIVHVINNLGTGGAETLVVNMCQELRSQGHDVRIVTLTQVEGVPHERAKAAGLSVRALSRRLWDPRIVWRLRRAVRGADAVHVHLFPSLYISAVALWGAPKVFTEHSTENRRRSKAWLRFLDRLAYAQFTAVVAISEGVRSALGDYFASIRVKTRIAVIENAIAMSYFENLPVGHTKTAGTLNAIAIGTLDDRKNFSLAIDAVAQVAGATLTIVGTGPQREALSAQIARSGLESTVHLAGAKSAVRDELDAHDCLLSTSKYEGFSLVAAEAQARGLPVIGPNVAGLRDVVPHNQAGLLYSQEDGVQGVASALSMLRDDEDLYASLSTGARENAQRFGMDVCARHHVDLYGTVLGDRTEG